MSGRIDYDLDDYLNPTQESLRQQWSSLLQRKTPALGTRQVAFLPLETVLCLCAAQVVDHKKYGSGSAHRAGAVVQYLSSIFKRPPTSILAKMANLDGSRSNGGRYDRIVGEELADLEILHGLYRRILAVGRDMGFSKQVLPDFLGVERKVGKFPRLDKGPSISSRTISTSRNVDARHGMQGVHQSRDERIRDSLVRVLSSMPEGATKYELVRKMTSPRSTKSEINSVLYRYPKLFRSDGATPPRWFLVQKIQPVGADNGGARKDSPRGHKSVTSIAKRDNCSIPVPGPDDNNGRTFGARVQGEQDTHPALIDEVLQLLGPTSVSFSSEMTAPPRDSLLDSEKVNIYANYKGTRTDALFFPETRAVRIESGPLGGREYRTPSGAANALVAMRTPGVSPTTNGWAFWVIDDGTGRKLGSLKSALN